MSRRPVIPLRGDVSRSHVAQLMGLSGPDFDAVRPQLEERGFPRPDPTTGLYCIEAVDRWRLRRHASMFPQLTGAGGPTNASDTFDERRRAVFGKG